MRLARLAFPASAILFVGALLWAGARPRAEALTRPAVPAGADAATRGAAAFEGAGFGGISLDALATNAVPWRLVAAALVLDERTRDPAAPLDTATVGRVLARFGFLPGARRRSIGRPARGPAAAVSRSA